MVQFVKLTNEDDAVSVIVVDEMHLVIKRNDVGVSIDYYTFMSDQPFKSEQIWFDDLEK